jgi:hypothetical protein
VEEKREMEEMNGFEAEVEVDKVKAGWWKVEAARAQTSDLEGRCNGPVCVSVYTVDWIGRASNGGKNDVHARGSTHSRTDAGYEVMMMTMTMMMRNNWNLESGIRRQWVNE